MSVLELTSNNFEEEVLKSDKTVLVDFWASWCAPCKMMSPVVDAIAEEVGEKVKVGKVNVDEQPELAIKYNVMSIPTFLIFRNGEVANMTVGVQDKTELMNLL